MSPFPVGLDLGVGGWHGPRIKRPPGGVPEGSKEPPDQGGEGGLRPWKFFA